MRNSLEPVYWVVLLAVLLFGVVLPATKHMLERRLEYLESPEGQAHLREQIEDKILERYGRQALAEFEEGTTGFLGAVNDVVLAEVYGLPVMTFLLTSIGGIMLIAWGAEKLFPAEREPADDPSPSD